LQSNQPMVLCAIDKDGLLTQFALNPKAKTILPKLLIGANHVKPHSTVSTHLQSLTSREVSKQPKRNLTLFYNGEEIYSNG